MTPRHPKRNNTLNTKNIKKGVSWRSKWGGTYKPGYPCWIWYLFGHTHYRQFLRLLLDLFKGVSWVLCIQTYALIWAMAIICFSNNVIILYRTTGETACCRNNWLKRAILGRLSIRISLRISNRQGLVLITWYQKVNNSYRG